MKPVHANILATNLIHTVLIPCTLRHMREDCFILAMLGSWLELTLEIYPLTLH